MTTVSEHRYAARVTGPEGDIEISIVEDAPAGISFDAGRFPHVEGRVTLAVEDALLLEQLDPRESRRLIVDVSASFPNAERARSFDLGIRQAIPNRADSTVSLRLASDEAILAEKAPLADDTTPRTQEGSLRAVCNYVLGKIGASLQPGAVDANVTAYWPATNAIYDPACAVVSNFTSGGNAHTINRVTGLTGLPIPGSAAIYFSSGAAGQAFIQFAGGDPAARVGDKWTLQAWMNRAVAAGPNGILRVYEIDAAGTTLRTIESAPVAISSATWTPLTLTFTVQNPRTAKIMVYVSAAATAGGQTYALTAPMLHKAGEPIPAFSGSAGATPGYTYSWSGAANASTSTRTPIIERRPESLVWSAGISGMDFLHNLLMAAGLRLVCDEQRRWTLRHEDYRAEGSQDWRYGVNIETAEEQLSRDDDSWFDGAVYEYVWTDEDGLEQRRTDAYSLSGTPTKVIRRELRNTPYPGPGRAQHVVERAQGKGRTITVTGIPLWTERTDQALAILLDGSPIQTGIAATVAYDFSNDTVAISSRTTDTPAGAIDLLQGTINSLPGTINAL
ncbi:hypothetical protein [Microbacterium sp. K27]|uniref:hypothetical protein n=1 Tax=Microbacterium sp. K27 TaxID=2305445 RepID=UPI00109B8B6C|nr:hypothetical protein [Microbacterium sp. K27]